MNSSDHYCLDSVMTDRRDIWPAVHHEREALADDLARLTPEQWSAPTACAGWDVHDVVAHLVHSARTTRLGFARDMVLARFDFGRANDRGVRHERRADPGETLAELRSVVSRTATPPAALATRLVEAYVHGEDIRRAVGLTGSYPAEHLTTALAYQLRTAVAWGGGKERADGLRLVASDASFASGSGPEVQGSLLSLLLAVSGRPVAPEELSGPSATTLTGRAA